MRRGFPAVPCDPNSRIFLSLYDQLPTIADTQAPLELFLKNGYYQVGDQIFNHKVNALECATRTNQPATWEFNTDVYRKISWRQPPALALRELYRLRAQQLRDRYDHLILAFSGGADSTTVLDTFVNNGIHLDQVWCDWPHAQTHDRYRPSRDPSPGNILSEWDYSVKPRLDQLVRDNPEIAITLTDATADWTLEDFEDTCTITLAHNYPVIKRWRHLRDLLAHFPNPERVAVIMGVDKLHFSIKHDVFCAQFYDAVCTVKSDSTDVLINVEYFFWARDLPELPVAQAHVVYNWLQTNGHLGYLWQIDRPDYEQNFDLRASVIKRLLYPDWSMDTFQTTKSNSLVWSEFYPWVWREPTRAIDSWQSSINTRMAAIDPKYFRFHSITGKILDYRPMWSRLYPIAHVKETP